MDLPHALREAIETQVIDHEPAQAALVLRNAVADLGAEEVIGGLLDSAAVALRRMVAETDEAYDQVELLDRLALDGAVPADNIDILARMLTLAASTAGGVRPPVEGLVAELGAERTLFGAWLTTLATIRVVSLSLERTEVEIAEEVLAAVQAF
ncbi:MAG TPA: hypothetical protein VFH36_12745 [Acidimicrobiales bacterium]|jgi:hypothetical protein|nr:hypothetical protein [Acidimicrobiales bacterium]